MKNVLVVSLVFSLFIGLASCSNSKIAIDAKNSSKQEQPRLGERTTEETVEFVPTTMDAKAIIDIYKQAKDSEDVEFRGKFINITGVISNLGDNIEAEPYPFLCLYREEGENGGSVVNCYFDKKDLETIKTFKKGNSVKLIGKVDSSIKLLNKNGNYYYIVTANDCHSVSLITTK